MLVLLVINGALRKCCDGEYLVRSSAYNYRIYLYSLSLALAALISDAASGSASRATRSSSRRAAGLEFISVLRGH
jgi:hypothetical protein